MARVERSSGSARRPAAPKPRDEDLDFFGLTHRGRVRKDNQDHFLFGTLHKTMQVRGTSLPDAKVLELPSQRLASVGMVADGVGGRAGGEAASRTAVEAIAGYLTQTVESFYSQNARDEEAFLDSLERAARRGHEAVLARAAGSDHERGVATTFTMMIAVWPAVYLLHVGDSRCYRYRDGTIRQLTRDQTMAQDLVDSGILPPDRAAASRFAHVLSSSLGGQATRPVVSRSDLQPGDVILLCTDGLTKHVSDDQITARLRDLESSERACRALVSDALEGGGTDNVTALVLRAIHPPA